MKKSIFTLLVLLLSAIQTTTAYEYFTIYFSDGTKSEAFYATDVDSICYSKLSLDSIVYDDWQVQEIYTCDSVYRYSLAQIDSLSFKDVDENQVAKDIVSVSEAITPLYNSCSSPLELSEYLPTIQSIIGVEDAYICNQALYVKIRDWGNLSFYYPIKESISDDGINIPSLSRNKVASSTINNENDEHQQTEALKACVVNQQYRDDNRKWFQKTANIFTACYGYMGIDTITINMPSPEFFQKEMFNYDILFIKTHGSYDKKNDLHWLLTGEELFSRDPEYGLTDTKIDLLVNKLILRLHHLTYSPRKMSFSWIPERRNGDSIHVLYTTISEEYIRSSKSQFRNAGSAIVFNTACESMMGSPNIEEAFKNRGAGCYMGYDDTNYIGPHAGIHFFARLLVGKSVYSAFETLPDSCKSQDFYIDEKNNIYHDKPSGKKTRRCTPNLKPDSHISNLCIIHPETISAEELYEDDNLSIRLKGGIKIFPNFGDLLGNTELGFEMSTSSDMKQDFHHLGEDDGVEYKVETPYLNIELTLANRNLKPNTTYYYRAYMNDGYSDCYGEVKSFCTQVVPYVMSFHNDDNNTSVLFDKDNTYTSVLLCDGKEYEESWNQVEEIAKKYGLNPTKYAGSFTFCDSEGKVINGESIKAGEVMIRHSSYIIFDPSFANFKPKTTYRWFSSQVVESIKNIQYLNTERLIDMGSMFSGCSSLKNLDLNGLNTSKVTDMSFMFDDCSSLESVDLSSFDTSNVTDMRRMFSGCSSLTSLDLRSFNTSNVTSMSGMFHGCSSLKNLNLSNFDTNNVTSFQDMFGYCRELNTIDISNFVITGSTGGLSAPICGIFGGCLSLTKIIFNNGKLKNTRFDSQCFQHYSTQPGIDEFPPLDFDMENLEVSNCLDVILGCNNIVSVNLSHLHKVDSIDRPIVSDCSSIKNVNLSYFSAPVLSKITNLFKNCASLESVDMSNMSVPNLEMLGGSGPFDAMFYKCNALSYINLDNLYAPRTKCIYFSYFSNSIKNVSICNINAPNLKQMSFSGFSSLERIYVDNTWDNVNLDWNGFMFSDCYNLVGGSGTKIGNNIYGYNHLGNPLYYYCGDSSNAAHIDGGKDNPGLFTAK